jgi:hypothetical protein
MQENAQVRDVRRQVGGRLGHQVLELVRHVSLPLALRY